MQYNGFEYVDLGLSVNWATCNVGADDPLDGGLYFQWGDTVGYTKNDAVNKVKGFGPDINLNNSTKYYGSDSKQTLDIEDDAANVYMGGNWRTPTKEEFIELIYTCKREHEGSTWIFKSKINDNRLIIPQVGYICDNRVLSFKKRGFYWSRNSIPSLSGFTSLVLDLLCDSMSLECYNRLYGFTLRGVFKK